MWGEGVMIFFKCKLDNLSLFLNKVYFILSLYQFTK